MSAGERDAGIDAVRAVAMAGVVGGHWLVTGLVVDEGGVLRQASPLAAMPQLAPVTWALQTLGLFFFAGGFAATRALNRRGRPVERSSGTLRTLKRAIRANGLVRAVLTLLGFWAVVLAAGAATGVPAGTLRTVAVLVVSPLWFLLPYFALRALTRPGQRLLRHGGALIAGAVAVVAASDAGLLPGWLAVGAAWSVPWVLGMLVARDRLRMPPAALFAAGAAGLAVLIGAGGYPVSAVGVPGDGRSNLAPPSLAAVALAVAQIGVVLLVRARLSRPARPVALLNRAVLPVYLSHQSVLLAVTAAAALLHPRMPGLLSPPDGPAWVVQRIAWLPVLAGGLTALVALGRARRKSARHAGPTRPH
jgi:hypothetical protein